MSKNYSEYFRTRFINHDLEFKKLTKEIIEQNVKPKNCYRKKRDYHDAFTKAPPYTRFSDDLYK